MGWGRLAILAILKGGFINWLWQIAVTFFVAECV